MNKHFLAGAAAFAAATIAGVYSDAWADDIGHIEMQQNTPPQFYMAEINEQRDNPAAAIWVYIAAVVSGANLGAVLASGEPVACRMHSFSDTRATSDLILEYLLASDMIGDPRATLEITTVAAFAWAYPCGVKL